MGGHAVFTGIRSYDLLMLLTNSCSSKQCQMSQHWRLASLFITLQQHPRVGPCVKGAAVAWCLQDFYNLVDVYLDAVLHPNCIKDPRIFAQEGWHFELDNPEVRASMPPLTDISTMCPVMQWSHS